MEIILKKSNEGVKNPKHTRNNIFTIYSPKKVTTKPSTYLYIDTKIVLSLPEKTYGFITTIFRGNEINEVRQGKQHLWIETLKKSF